MTEKDFVYIQVDPKMLKRANDRAFNIGELKNSITSGKGNLAACLGEDAVKYYLKGKYVQKKNRNNYDLVVQKKTIEVKTKRRTVDPKIEYEVSIAQTSCHQKPDYYVFTSVKYENEKPKTVCIIGYIEYNKFFEQAIFVPKNKLDKSNWFYAKANMYNLSHSKLLPIKDLCTSP